MTGSVLLGSVVIPAHNEEAVIGQCLDTLLAGFQPGELDVVVACNGCSDGTAKVALSARYQVRVLEIETPSKIAALRAADEVLTAFPRLYVDADVLLTSDAARRVLDRLRAGHALAARPPIRYKSELSSVLVRSYYRSRSRVPSLMNSVWGAGAYGLSAQGRARFGEFPDVIADDLFVDQRFQRSEIEIVATDPVVVNVPRRSADLVRILRRTYQGNTQVCDIPEGADPAETGPSTSRGLLRLARTRPMSIIDVGVYIAFALFARLTLMVATPTQWQRDNSSRGHAW